MFMHSHLCLLFTCILVLDMYDNNIAIWELPLVLSYY